MREASANHAQFLRDTGRSSVRRRGPTVAKGRPVEGRLFVVTSALALVMVLATSARADAPAEEAHEGVERAEGDASAEESGADDRSAEHYRGRSRAPTADEVLVWIPRVLAFPIHLVTEYLIRVPLLAFLTWAEQAHLFALVDRLLNPTPDFSWAPTVTLEAGVFALPGLQAHWRNAGVPGHEIRIAGTFAGDSFWSAQLRDEWSFSPLHFGVRGGYVTRPDRAFFGLGPDTPNLRTNFRETRGDASAFVALTDERHVRLDLSGGWSYEAVGPGMSPSTQFLDAGGAPGVGPFDLVLVSGELTLDSRRAPEENGGLRLHALATGGVDPSDGAHDFLTVNAEVEAAVEISRPDRVLATRVYVAETAALGGGALPFLHLPTLGWNNHQGFVLGRFRGEAAFLAEIRYRYPVAYFVDVQWVASVGNVFQRDFSDFVAGALTGSLGVGLRTRRTGGDPIEVTVAIGTSRFDAQDFGIDSVRLYLSTTRGL